MNHTGDMRAERKRLRKEARVNARELESGLAFRLYLHNGARVVVYRTAGGVEVYQRPDGGTDVAYPPGHPDA
jgi:hypothetical protein